MKKIIIILLLACSYLSAQQDYRFADTSFTTRSAYLSVIKQFPNAVPAEAFVPERVYKSTNIVYASHGPRNLCLDLFTPVMKTNSPVPLVLIIHGGGWRSGDKKMEWPIAIRLASEGYAAATVEYRLSPEALYPAGVFDIKESIRWAKENANKYGIDSNRIIAAGCSAGGELAALIGTTCSNKKFEGETYRNKISTDVYAVIDIDGILDFTDPAESGKDGDPLKPSAGKAWFGSSFKDNPEIWKEASPINYVNPKTAPILFINSSNERFHAGRDEYIRKLNLLNIYSEVHTIPNTPHPFWLFHPWFDDAMGYILKFLETIKK